MEIEKRILATWKCSYCGKEVTFYDEQNKLINNIHIEFATKTEVCPTGCNEKEEPDGISIIKSGTDTQGTI